MSFEDWWEQFSAEHEDWRYADSEALRKAAYKAGAASRDAEVVSLTNQRDYEYVRAENALMERDLDALQADNAELVAALESVEWTRLGEMPEGNHCCYCGALKKHGHVTGCKVANVLKRTTLAQALAKLRNL